MHFRTSKSKILFNHGEVILLKKNPLFLCISEHWNSNVSSTMVNWFYCKFLEILLFSCISEHRNSEYSSTMVNCFFCIPEHWNSKFGRRVEKIEKRVFAIIFDTFSVRSLIRVLWSLGSWPFSDDFWWIMSTPYIQNPRYTRYCRICGKK